MGETPVQNGNVRNKHQIIQLLCLVDFNVDQSILGNLVVFKQQRKSLNTFFSLHLWMLCDKCDSIMHPLKWMTFIFFLVWPDEISTFIHTRFQLQSKKKLCKKFTPNLKYIHTHTTNWMNTSNQPEIDEWLRSHEKPIFQRQKFDLL